MGRQDTSTYARRSGRSAPRHHQHSAIFKFETNLACITSANSFLSKPEIRVCQMMPIDVLWNTQFNLKLSKYLVISLCKLFKFVKACYQLLPMKINMPSDKQTTN